MPRAPSATRLSDPTRRRLTSVVGLAALAALVATSAPPTYVYSFSTELEPAIVELTADNPNLRLRLQARATGLAPNGAPTTARAEAFVEGRITNEGVASDGLGAFVVVRTTFEQGDAGSQEISALTAFGLASDLQFEGDCAGLSEADPCEGDLFIEFRREEEGAGSGTVRVEWTLALSASVDKGEHRPDEGPFDLPWDVVLETAP
jgi:hypothetical protein